MSDIFLSVIIPSFDEMANLQKGVLDKVDAYLKKKKISYEVLVVDDGSKDGGIKFVSEFIKDHKNFHLIQNSHMGKAGAVTSGMLAATGQYRLFTDMDQATPIEQVDTLLPLFEKGNDVVVGSRSTKREGSPLIRLFISRANMTLRKAIVGLKDIDDTQCGFKMFRGDVAQVLFEKVKEIHHGFKTIHGSNVTAGFDVELLFIAEQYGYKIQEVSVPWLYVETRRVNPLTDSIQGLMELFRIKKNAMSGIYSRS